MRACVRIQDRPQRHRTKEVGRLHTTTGNESGAQTLLFGSRDPPRPVFIPPLLSMTSICAGQQLL